MPYGCMHYNKRFPFAEKTYKSRLGRLHICYACAKILADTSPNIIKLIALTNCKSVSNVSLAMRMNMQKCSLI